MSRATVLAGAVAFVLVVCGAALNDRPPTLKDGVVATSEVHHDPNGLDQIIWATAENPALRFIFLRLAIKPDDVLIPGVRIYRMDEQGNEGFRDYNLEPYARTQNAEYRSLTIPLAEEPGGDDLHSQWRGYRLWLDDGDQIYWVGADTISTKQEKPQRFKEMFRPSGSFQQKYGSDNPDDSGVSDRVLSIPGWVQDAVFYEIVPDRFRNGDLSNDPDSALAWGAPATPGSHYGGDLHGVIDALPYLDSLGVNAIYLSSIFTAAGNLRDGVADYDSVDPHYGDQATFKSLVEAAHQRRMKVLLEGTFDHVSAAHPYFRDAVDFGKESDLWTWFHFQGYPVVTLPAPNYATWNGRVDLPSWNFDNEATRSYLLNVGRRWLDDNIDGWGLVDISSAPHEFWARFREAVKSMSARAYVVGRLHGDTRSWNMGDQFDAVTDDRLLDACRGFFADTTLDAAAFDQRLGRIRVDTPDPLNRISFNSLHGENQSALHDPGTPLDSLRITSPAPRSLALEKLMIFFQLTYTGAPVILYGDEIGMSGESDRRNSFNWRAADQNSSIREYYRNLLLLRRQHSALRRGSFLPVLMEGGIYAYLRRSAEEVLLVVVNRTPAPVSFKLPLPKGAVAVTQKDAVDLLGGSRHAIRSGEVHVKDVAPFSGAILRLQ